MSGYIGLVLAGFAEVDITPKIFSSCQLVGFFREDNTAKGILHPLKAQVLVFRANMETCCVVTIDSIGFTTGLTNDLRQKIATRLKIKRENVMVCFSHTHAAPDAAAGEAAYYKFVNRKILGAVDKAAESMFPAKAAWDIAPNTVGVNRREGSTAVDPRLGVLKIANADTDKTEVLLLRVTAHANVLTSDNLMISSDFFGVTRERLEAQYGCGVMMTQGASGNVRAKFRQENADFLEEHAVEAAQMQLSDEEKQRYRTQSLEALEKNADEIARAVDEVYNRMVPVPIYRLRMFSDEHTFYADVPTVERAQEVAEEARGAGIEPKWWLKEVERLIEEGIARQSSKKEIQYFCLNQGCLCGIADEPMCEIAIDIQKQAADDFLFFGGYTNGYEGYLASAEEYDRGGYEVLWSNVANYGYYDRVMPLNRDTAEKLTQAVVRRWRYLDK